MYLGLIKDKKIVQNIDGTLIPTADMTKTK